MDTEEKERRAEIVIESYAGIIPYCEAFYLHSIIYSAERCLESFQQYDYMKSQDANPNYLISIVQEAVGHAAALSRYFWVSPQGKKSEPNQNNHRTFKILRQYNFEFCV